MANIDHLDVIRQKVQALVQPQIVAMGIEETPSVMQPPVTQPAAPTSKKLDSTSGAIGIGVMVVLISIVLIFFMSQKKSGEYRSQGLTGPTISQQQQQPSRYMSTTEAHAWTATMNNRITSVEEQMKRWAYRVWLLAVVGNENAADKFNQQRNPIILDEQWKLSRVPETMQLTDEQKRELKQSLK